jgi:hypothetical protein
MLITHIENHTFKITGSLRFAKRTFILGNVHLIKTYNTLFDELIQSDDGRLFLIHNHKVVEQVSEESADDFLLEYAVALTDSLEDFEGVAK